MPISISWRHTFSFNVSFINFCHITPVFTILFGRCTNECVLWVQVVFDHFRKFQQSTSKASFESNLTKSYKKSYSAKVFLVKLPTSNTLFPQQSFGSDKLGGEEALAVVFLGSCSRGCSTLIIFLCCLYKTLNLGNVIRICLFSSYSLYWFASSVWSGLESIDVLVLAFCSFQFVSSVFSQKLISSRFYLKWIC